MSVVILGNGTTTSSIFIDAFGTYAALLKDTIPNTAIFADVPNTTRVVGDGGYDYKYRRGKPRGVFSLQWAMLPVAQLQDIQRIWKLTETYHWMTIQTTDLSEKSQLYNTTVGTGNFFQGSLDGINPMPGSGTNWIIPSKWVLWHTGANAGKHSRIFDFLTNGQFQIEDALTFANGDRFYVGWPASFVSPLRVEQYGNIRTHYNVSVDCEVVIF